MPDARKKAGHEPDDGVAARRSRHVTAVLLLTTAAVIGVTIYIAVTPPEGPPGPEISDPGPSQAERTRQAIEDMLARADAIDPKAGDESLVARRRAYEAACELARKFIQLTDRTDVVVRPALAKAQLRLGELQKAERTVDELLKLSPASAEGLWMKGQLLAPRDRDAALEYFRRAAESDQAGAEVWARYGAELMSRSRFEEAKDYLTRAARAGRRDNQTLLALAMLAMRAEDFARAEQLFDEIGRTGRGSVRLLSMLAEAQKQGGRPAEAEKTLRKALDLQQLPELRLQLGDVLILLRRRAEAAEMFAKAAENPSLEPVAALKAAKLYYILDKYALAMKYIDRAAEHGATDEVLQWRTKIDNARFGEPASAEGPTFRLPRTLGPA
ncbi:MAG: tetratricopeptide repeat protein, partial [Phycisphaerae bacterium]